MILTGGLIIAERGECSGCHGSSGEENITQPRGSGVNLVERGRGGERKSRLESKVGWRI